MLVHASAGGWKARESLLEGFKTHAAFVSWNLCLRATISSYSVYLLSLVYLMCVLELLIFLQIKPSTTDKMVSEFS